MASESILQSKSTFASRFSSNSVFSEWTPLESFVQKVVRPSTWTCIRKVCEIAFVSRCTMRIESSPERERLIPSASTYSSGVEFDRLKNLDGGGLAGSNSTSGLESVFVYVVFNPGKVCALEYNLGGIFMCLMATSRKALRPVTLLTRVYAGSSVRGGVLGGVADNASVGVGD